MGGGWLPGVCWGSCFWRALFPRSPLGPPPSLFRGSCRLTNPRRILARLHPLKGSTLARTRFGVAASRGKKKLFSWLSLFCKVFLFIFRGFFDTSQSQGHSRSDSYSLLVCFQGCPSYFHGFPYISKLVSYISKVSLISKRCPSHAQLVPYIYIRVSFVLPRVPCVFLKFSFVCRGTS